MKIKHCIIIDDDLWTVLYHKRLINTLDPLINTIQFVDADQGLEQISTNYPIGTHTAVNTVVLLDMNMPGMSGRDFLQQFSELPDSVKDQVLIIVVTSLDEFELTSGKVHFVRKPLTLGQMKNILRAEAKQV